MSAYLLHYVEIAKDLKVLRFEDGKLASVYAFEQLEPERIAKVVSSEDSLRDRTAFSTSLLVALYNAMGPEKLLAKFENHETGVRRTFALIEWAYGSLELTKVELPNDSPTIQPSSEESEQETTTMAKSNGNGTKTEKAKRSRAPGTARGVTAQPAGTVAEFKQVRAGSDRAHVLKLMDGSKTPEQIAKSLGGGKFDGKYIMQHAYCLKRDSGIGYEITAAGHLNALFPKNRSFADAIKEAPAKAAKTGKRGARASTGTSATA